MKAGTNRLFATQETAALSGAGLLGLVTTGMYDDPLSMYREYIQNAADAAAESGLPQASTVHIELDVVRRRIRIRDNGPGLSFAEATERLLPVGRSGKRIGTDRGFRGIGRLAGLAFAKTVSFTTRAQGDQPVTRLTWYRDRLPELSSTESELEQAIRDCVDLEALPGLKYPNQFFDVEIGEVARHAIGLLLNRDAVRDYIGEVCPVPLSTEFPFTDRVNALFAGKDSPFALEVYIEGDSEPIERPYRESIRISSTKEASFSEFEVVRIPSVDDKRQAAVGWIAHSSYLGAIPKELRARGIRARVGNIQIGGEGVFDHLFVEERFNRWCIGELHILDSRIVPNARRDYFQPGPHLRNLENQLTPVLRDISTRCRKESTARNRARRTTSSLCNIEDLYALAISGYLTAHDSARLVQEAFHEIAELRKGTSIRNLDDDILERLATVEDKLTNFTIENEHQHFSDLTPSEAAAYQRVFGVLTTLAQSPSDARALIEQVFAASSELAPNGSETSTDQQSITRTPTRLALEDTGALAPK